MAYKSAKGKVVVPAKGLPVEPPADDAKHCDDDGSNVGDDEVNPQLRLSGLHAGDWRRCAQRPMLNWTQSRSSEPYGSSRGQIETIETSEVDGKPRSRSECRALLYLYAAAGRDESRGLGRHGTRTRVAR